MRVLFVTNRFPGDAMRGDQLRALQQLRHLGARHRITLLSFADATSGDALRDEVGRCCERVVVAQDSPLGRLPGLMSAIWRGRPLQVAMFDAPARRRAVEALLAETAFDLVHVQLARLGGIVEQVSPRPCVLDLVDALSLNMARRADFDRGPLRTIARFESGRLLRYERALCAFATEVAVCSPADQMAIGRQANLHRVDNGVDLERFGFVAARTHPGDLVFVGNLGYFPNVDAVTWFARAVMPLLRGRVPGLRLRLVGARPAAALRRLAAGMPDIDLVGPVADVHPYLAAAGLAIAPMRAGSGQQLKVLEAMASGTPVIASSTASAGMDAVDGEHLGVADDAPAFAEAILRLQRDRELAAGMARRARQWVEQTHAWSHSGDALEQLWLRAVRA